MNRQWKKEEEKQIKNARILNDITSQLSNGFKNVNSKVIDFAKVMKKGQDHLEETIIINKRAADHENYMQRKQIRQNAFDESMYNKKVSNAAAENRLQREERERDRQHHKQIADNRNKNRIQTEQVHGENVRFNLAMRKLYKDQSQSLGNVMNLMTGKGGAGGAAMGGVSTIFNTLSIGSSIIDTRKKLKEARDKKEMMEQSGQTQGVFENEYDRLKRQVPRLEEFLKQQQSALGIFGAYGGKGDTDSKWAKRLEFITEWAKKNKNGIIISAASIGLMFITFKKLLSVSPMLQKMLEIMNLAFNLVLRPFGDFIGFILRPIAMSMLQIVMPFFQKAYPLLMELGNTIGEALVNWDLEKVIISALTAIPPLEVLDALNPFTDNPTAGGQVGAIGAGLLATSVGALYGTGKIVQWGAKKIFNPLGDTAKPSASGGGGQNYSGKTGSGGKQGFWTGNTKAAEGLSKKAALMAKLSKVMRIASPIGLALMGWEGITSTIKHFDPEMYQSMRDSTEFMGVGREFIGLGEQSMFEDLWGGYNWVKDSLGVNNSILDSGATISNDVTGFNGIATQTANGGTNITFNIDKVEKGVDVNMIALQVKAILETSNTRIG